MTQCYLVPLLCPLLYVCSGLCPTRRNQLSTVTIPGLVVGGKVLV